VNSIVNDLAYELFRIRYLPYETPDAAELAAKCFDAAEAFEAEWLKRNAVALANETAETAHKLADEANRAARAAEQFVPLAKGQISSEDFRRTGYVTRKVSFESTR